jgi:superfamily II DNA or RNA helicase
MSFSIARYQLRFPASRRDRGEQYWQQGKVRLEDLTETLAKATVRGTRRYQVTIEGYEDPATAVLHCTCPDEDAPLCKHAWATLLAVEAELQQLAEFSAQLTVQSQLQGKAKASGKPQPVAEEEDEYDPDEWPDLSGEEDPFDDGEDEDDDDEDEFWDGEDTLAEGRGEVGDLPAAMRDAMFPADDPDLVASFRVFRNKQLRDSIAANGNKAWQQRLDLLQTEAAAAGGKAAVYEFFLIPFGGEPSDDGDWMVVAQKRAVRKDGTAGAVRQPEPLSMLCTDVPEADRQLLALLENAPQRGLTRMLHGSGVFADGVPARWFGISPWMLPGVLKALAQRGSVWVSPVTAPGAFDRAKCLPLEVDIELAFEFAIEVEGGAKARKQQVVASYRRGEERIPADAVGLQPPCPFAVLGGRVVPIEYHGAERLAQMLREQPLEAAPAEMPALLASLARLPGAEHFLAGMLATVPLGVPVGEVSLLLPKAVKQPVPVTLQFRYEGRLVAADSPGVMVEGVGPALRRDLAAEQRLQAGLLAQTVEVTPVGLCCRREQVPALAHALLAMDFRVLAEGKLVQPFELGNTSVSSGIDWFEIGGEVQFAEYQASIPELLRSRQTPEGFVELGDGSYGMLPVAWQRRIEALRALGVAADGKVLRLPSAQALLLDALLEEQAADDVTVDRKFAALRQRLRSFAEVKPLSEPAQFAGELRPYQREGLGWLHFLREFGLGGCLADDMGLGKTVQVLALLAAVHANGAATTNRPSVLVAPRSVLPNWHAEAARFAPKLRVLDFSGPDRWLLAASELPKADLVLTTYGVVRSDAARFAAEKVRFHYAILDESQMAKNADSQTSKAVRLLQADHRLALTGTPVENHLGELWSLFEYLNPGMLGKLKAFRELFAVGQTAAELQQRRELVQRALRPVLLRRTKAQVLTDLPPKIEQTLWCDLEPAQRRRYDELRQHYRQALLEEQAWPVGSGVSDAVDDKKRFLVLEALLRLRQAACHEGLLEKKLRAESSAKFDVLLPRLEELAEEGHKVLVFSQFTSLLDLLEPQLAARQLGFERLDGQTRDREQRVRRFQQPGGPPVFLVSLKAGGTGLNLTAADYVFLLDPWWNPAVEMQAVDRAHRIGQQRTVHAYRLVCRGTVEERVLELQQQKRALCEAILGNERSLLQDLTRQDLELLLR